MPSDWKVLRDLLAFRASPSRKVEDTTIREEDCPGVRDGEQGAGWVGRRSHVWGPGWTSLRTRSGLGRAGQLGGMARKGKVMNEYRAFATTRQKLKSDALSPILSLSLLPFHLSEPLSKPIH